MTPSIDLRLPRRACDSGGAGATLQVGDRWSAFTFYNPQLGGGDVVAHTISAGVGIRF